MRADKILVLYEGKIIEQGKHDELVDRRGMYTTSWCRSSLNAA